MKSGYLVVRGSNVVNGVKGALRESDDCWHTLRKEVSQSISVERWTEWAYLFIVVNSRYRHGLFSLYVLSDDPPQHYVCSGPSSLRAMDGELVDRWVVL